MHPVCLYDKLNLWRKEYEMCEVINIYINVVDRRINPPKGLLPDTAILATVLKNDRRVLITVLPSEEGIRPFSEKIADLMENTTVKPDYYLRTDFKALEEIIDAIRGIEIHTEKNYKIGETRYPKGLNKMGGRHAMALYKKSCETEEEMLAIRESVVEGLVRKALKGFSLTYDLPKLYSVAKKEVETNIDGAVIKKLAAKRTSADEKWHVIKQYMLEKDTEKERKSKIEKLKLFNIRLSLND